METNRHPDPVQQQLHEMQRGETAAWVVYPPTPIWWAVGFGLWAAAFALVVGLLDGSAQALAQLGLVVTIALLMAWDRRRRGTYPSGRPPREFVSAIVRMLLGAAGVAGLAWLAGEWVGVWLAAGVAGVGAFAVISRYEHEYAAVAARIRERLR
jgi:hypothetical protein